MNSILTLTLFVLLTFLLGTDAQWYIIKKNYPTTLMNYPNPGKRSISDEELNLLNIDCSIPYSYLNSYDEKTVWLQLCSDQRSPLTAIDDSSLSTSNNLGNEFYSASQLISVKRRTPPPPPPYLNDQRVLFNRLLMKRFGRSMNK